MKSVFKACFVSGAAVPIAIMYPSKGTCLSWLNLDVQAGDLYTNYSSFNKNSEVLGLGGRSVGITIVHPE